MGYLTISTNVDAIKHITDGNFSFRKTAQWCTVRATQLTAAAPSTNTAFGEKCDFRVSPFSAEAQVI